MKLLAIDVGTTHCKAGLFDISGHLLRSTTAFTPSYQSPSGDAYYRPEVLWQAISQITLDTIADTPLHEIAGVGVASMAETGLLLERRTGKTRTDLIPWFNMAAQAEADYLQQNIDVHACFLTSGIRPSFKCSLAKLLWIKKTSPELLKDSIWLSTADYIVYRLTGQLITDYSLAGRTYAFRIDEHTWHESLLNTLGLSADIFPPAVPSGTPIKALSGILKSGTLVCIAGHDHVSAALAVGAIAPGTVLDSMGTAETLIGTMPAAQLGEAEFASGLSFGCHVVPERFYWMGGLSASGGSLEWIRSQLGEAPLSYDEINRLLATVTDPTQIIYFPYLAGSSIKPPDGSTRASFIGLNAKHGRAHLVKAVLEGTAFEMERLRQHAQALSGEAIETIIAVGGGTRNRHWVQIKSDVFGCPVGIPPMIEATLLGAAMLAGVGAGVYEDANAAVEAVKRNNKIMLMPDPQRHGIYKRLWQEGYMKLQEPLQKYFQNLAQNLTNDTNALAC